MMTDTISISDRMSSNSASMTSLNQLGGVGAGSLAHVNLAQSESGHTNPRTTTISTISVQCLNCRIVVALLQSRDILTLRVLESAPSFHTIGENAKEAEEMLQEHMNVLTKLQNIESPVEELLRRIDASLVTNPNPEVYVAMAESLGQAWKDLNNMLDRRRELLDLGAKFHTNHSSCLTKLVNTTNVEAAGRRETLKMYADVKELGKRIVEHMSGIEDSALSVAQVEAMLEELWLRLTQWKQELQIKQKSVNEDNLFDSLVQELDDIVKLSDKDPEAARRKLLLLISRLEEVELGDKSKTEVLIKKCYEQLDKLNQMLEVELSLNQFLLDNKQLHADNFKAEHEQRLRELEAAERQKAETQPQENAASGADADRKELIDIIKTRLKIRNEYEYLQENLLSFRNDDEINERLSVGQPASGGLEIDGALLTLKEKREQLENELYYQFKPQIDGIEQCLYDIGEIGTLKSLLEKTYQIQADLSHAPKFNGKEELEHACDTLIHQLETKINALYSVHQFLFENRELTHPDFQRLHEEQLLKVVYELHNHDLESRFHVRLGLRQMYDEMLHVPLEYDEEQVKHLLREDPTLDVRQALQNYRQARRIDELLATLDFPLPENLATARNDLEDFKSFETLIQTLLNPPNELVEKARIKKENILKCIELYEILERVDRYEYITRIEQLEMELFGSSTYAEAIQEEHRRSQEIEIAPPIPPPPSEDALYSKIVELEDERDRTKSPSPISIVTARPKSASIETQTEQYYEPYPPQSPPPLLNPFQAEAFVQQTEHLITEILERREQQLARSRTPLHEMETQTFEPQPIELSNEETQTTMLLLLPAPTISDEGCQTDDTPDYDFIPYSPPIVFSPPPTPGIEMETQTGVHLMKAVETQTFTYQVLANRQTQTPVEFIKALIPPVPPPKPKYVFTAGTQTSPPPPGQEPTLAVKRCEVDTQTVECPRFLSHMETQTLEDDRAPVTLEQSVVTTTTEQVHTYIHERIEQVQETTPFHDQGSQAGSFQQEMETQTTISIPIIESSPSSFILLQSPQIAKIFSNSESQTEDTGQVPSAVLHESSSEFKPSEQEVTPERNTQSSTVFADLMPQVVNLQFDVTSTAQEMCFASEEVFEKATYEEPLVPATPMSTPVEKPVKHFTAPPYQPVSEDFAQVPTGEAAPKQVEPSVTLEIPISIEKTPLTAPAEERVCARIQRPTATEGQPSEAVTSVSQYETKSSIFEQSYVLESTSEGYAQNTADTTMEKGSGTPLSKVSDRVKAWEIYQHEPDATAKAPQMRAAKDQQPELRPSSISDYRLLFQSPSPPEVEPHPVPTPGSINEFCKKFESSESMTQIKSTAATQKPAIPEKPKRISTVMEKPGTRSVPGTSTRIEPGLGSYNRLFESYEKTETQTSTQATDPSKLQETLQPTFATPGPAAQDYDKGIVSKFKQFFQSHEQQPSHTTSTGHSFFKPTPGASALPASVTFAIPEDTILTRTCQSSSATSTTRTHIKVQEMVKPSTFVPVTAGEWSEQSDYESDLDACKIPPIWIPPSQRDTMSPKFRPTTQASATQPHVITPIPIVRTSAFTSVQERSGIKPVPPPKPALSPIPSAGVAGTEQKSAFEKPIIALKPQIPSPRPGAVITTLKNVNPTPVVVPLPYESKKTSMTSTLTKTEETKFLLRPIKSPELIDSDPELKIARKFTQSPEYFVSITAPPITATTTAIQQSKDKQLSSENQETVRKLYETTTSSSSMTTTRRIVEQEETGIGGPGTAGSPDMEPYYNWREATSTSPFYPLHEQPGFYSSREETPVLRKSVETVIPIEREGEGYPSKPDESEVKIIKPEPILKGVEVKRDPDNNASNEQQPNSD